MLRINYSPTKTGQQWILCGGLARPWVQELRSCWEDTRQIAAGSQRHCRDLAGVTFIDENGERLLSDMRDAGVSFICRRSRNPARRRQPGRSMENGRCGGMIAIAPCHGRIARQRESEVKFPPISKNLIASAGLAFLLSARPASPLRVCGKTTNAAGGMRCRHPMSKSRSSSRETSPLNASGSVLSMVW